MDPQHFNFPSFAGRGFAPSTGPAMQGVAVASAVFPIHERRDARRGVTGGTHLGFFVPCSSVEGKYSGGCWSWFSQTGVLYRQEIDVLVLGLWTLERCKHGCMTLLICGWRTRPFIGREVCFYTHPLEYESV